MAKDPRVALQHFIAALENHLTVASQQQAGNDAALERAYRLLEEAFLDYEESLQDSYEELLPFELAEETE
jgi:ribosome assembly protein YihI (activator of Der GTPase)